MLKFTGGSVHHNFFRALSFKLLKISDRRVMQEHLGLLKWLEDSSVAAKAVIFACSSIISTFDRTNLSQHGNLVRFLSGLEQLNTSELSSMHAVTAVIENLTLILVTSSE